VGAAPATDVDASINPPHQEKVFEASSRTMIFPLRIRRSRPSIEGLASFPPPHC
jgi:hypothetical protein